MSGKNEWDITTISSCGQILGRVLAVAPGYGNKRKYWMNCDTCRVKRTAGLGGDKAATPADLCVGAKVDGWLLTSAGQYCANCVKRPWVRYVAAPRERYFEWWWRKVDSHWYIPAVLHTGGIFVVVQVVVHLMLWILTIA